MHNSVDALETIMELAYELRHCGVDQGVEQVAEEIMEQAQVVMAGIRAQRDCTMPCNRRNNA